METVENVAYLELSLRVREGVDDGFVERLMNDADRIYQVGNIYILDVTPLSKVRTASEIDNDNELRTQFCILFFLLLNIFLGVIGTFWFRTQQRRGEMAFTVPRFLIAILLTYLLMAIMIILGVLYPALQSMKVQPAEALRDE